MGEKKKKANEGLKDNEKSCTSCGKFYGTLQKASLCHSCFLKWFKQLK